MGRRVSWIGAIRPRAIQPTGALVFAAALSIGCESVPPPTPRAPVAEADHRTAEVVGMPGVRFWVDSSAAFQRWRERNAGAGHEAPTQLAA